MVGYIDSYHNRLGNVKLQSRSAREKFRLCILALAKSHADTTLLITQLVVSGYVKMGDANICFYCRAPYDVRKFEKSVATDTNGSSHAPSCIFHQSNKEAVGNLASKSRLRNIPWGDLNDFDTIEMEYNTLTDLNNITDVDTIQELCSKQLTSSVDNKNRKGSQSEESLGQYSRSPRLIYFVGPPQYTPQNESYQATRDRIREVRFERNHKDKQELEAMLHQSTYVRWRSFFDSRPNPSHSTTSSDDDKFTSWGRSMRLAYIFANQGFYYAPSESQNGPMRDKIRCAFCKRGKMGWWLHEYRESQCSTAYRCSDIEVSIALSKWHRSKSPTCPAVLDLVVDSIGLKPDQVKEIESYLSTFTLPTTISRREATMYIADNADAAGANRNEPAGGSGVSNDSGYSSLSSAERYNISRSKTAENQKELEDSNNLPEPVKWIVPSYDDELVGVSEHLLDRVKESQTMPAEDICALEAEVVYEPEAVWNIDDSKWIEQNNSLEARVAFAKPAFIDRLNEMSETPKYPEFVSQHVRLATFRRSVSTNVEETNDFEQMIAAEYLRKRGFTIGSYDWSDAKNKPHPEKLAAAGLFATHRNDETCCFWCGKCISEWDSECESWVYHAYKAPKCPYVLSRRGEAFVEAASQFEPNATHHWMRKTYSKILGFFPKSFVTIEPRNYKVRPELPVTRSIQSDCGLNLTLFQYAFEDEMRRTSKDFADNVKLIDAVRDMETRMEIIGLNDASEFVNKCRREKEEIQVGTHVSQMPERHPVARQVTTDSASVSNAQAARQVSGADDDSDRLSVCSVCLDKPLEVAFVPCGHLSTCSNCALQLNDCPVCRKAIKGTMKVQF